MSKVGDTVELAGEIRRNGVLTDPNALSLLVTDPAGTSSTYLWPPNSVSIVRDSVGRFRAGIVATRAGRWTFLWGSEGTFISTSTGVFFVDPAPEYLTIHVTDDTIAHNPISGVRVYVYKDEVTIVAGGVTDAFGVFTFTALSGTYNVDLVKSQDVFSGTNQITVADTGGSHGQVFTIQGHPVPISDPAPVRRVRVFGHVIGSDGLPQSSVRVTLETVAFGSTLPYLVSGGTGIDAALVGVVPGLREMLTNSAGYWGADVPVGALVRVVCADMRLEKIFRIPDDPRVVTLNIRDARPDPGAGSGIGITSDTPSRDVFHGVS